MRRAPRCARSPSAALRWYLQLEPIVARLLQGKALAPVLRSAAGRRPASARVLTQSGRGHGVRPRSMRRGVLAQPRAAGMINALLRRFLRERAGIACRRLMQASRRRSAHPAWLLSALAGRLPRAVAADRRGQQRPSADGAATGPVTHHARGLSGGACSSAAWARRAALAGHGAGPGYAAWRVAQLPGFDEGLVSVQDAGAQLAGAAARLQARRARAGCLRGSGRQDRGAARGRRGSRSSSRPSISMLSASS